MRIDGRIPNAISSNPTSFWRQELVRVLSMTKQLIINDMDGLGGLVVAIWARAVHVFTSAPGGGENPVG